ncbi:hypothetical protein DTO280E4_3835 [Paecilomyces variotii]|nr:hypothetical protein DTO280E4_3835 [Paecilomyces variotii]
MLLTSEIATNVIILDHFLLTHTYSSIPISNGCRYVRRSAVDITNTNLSPHYDALLVEHYKFHNDNPESVSIS